MDPDQTRALAGLVTASFYGDSEHRPPAEELVRAARHLYQLHESVCTCSLQGFAASCENILASALYLAESWDEGIEVLERSMEASGGGSAIDWLQFAELYRQLGDLQEGRLWYDRSQEWMRAHPQEVVPGACLDMLREHATELFEGAQ